MPTMRLPWSKDRTADRRKAERDLVYWAGVVGEIEGGYGLTIYDYTNDLDIHAGLRERVSRLPSSDPLRAQLATLDDRFEAATRPIDLATTRGTEQIRVPLNATGELLADLRERGWT
ncbi:hypothetical protein LRS13_02470 [Svornostia abyssi]|uniref:Uncharacterized protein n=1 Tax=Svornostia abyssi TaxID=2898438 RepID=A0ABY5PID5_9ACTN|nr:hypothetical protein LRS13_02470 [Parviterribacteraceae bacterium J379]